MQKHIFHDSYCLFLSVEIQSVRICQREGTEQRIKARVAAFNLSHYESFRLKDKRLQSDITLHRDRHKRLAAKGKGGEFPL